MFPSLGLKVGALALSEHKGPGPFAAAQGLRASLAVLPLLAGRVVVDRVQVDGLRVQVRRHPDGRTSIDDLLTPPEAPAPASADKEPSGPALRLDIAGIALRDVMLQFDDQRAGRKLALTGATLSTGRIRPGEPVDVVLSGHASADVPQLDADLQLQLPAGDQCWRL